MAIDRALPQAVRGNWHFVESAPDDKWELDDPRQVVSFGVDGTFVRYDIDGTNRCRAEQGDYTFDGDFLIVRGRRTQTYRVHRPAYWRWRLEGKKDQHTLYRGVVDGGEVSALSPEILEDLRLVVPRAGIEADFEGQGAIHRVMYTGDESKTGRLLASLSSEWIDDRSLWVGVAPLVSNVEPKLWDRIVEKSFVDGYLDGPTRVEEVVVRLFDSGQARQLDCDR